MFYSVRSAVTGSFAAAFLEGIKPPSKVNAILSRIRITAPMTGSEALTASEPVTAWMIAFPGTKSRKVMPATSSPAHRPIIKVSALNTWEILRLG